MQVSSEEFRRLKSTIAALRTDRLPWWEHWRTLSDYFLPRRYVWLLSPQERRRIKSRNPNILDSTGTSAARVLASGMMNGLTSPARPWFKLGLPGVEDISQEARVWLDDTEKRILRVMAQSNFYNALATMYEDVVVFGTAAALIYEDDENVIHCFNPALGEYYLAQDPNLRVNTFAREFTYKVHQVVARFGLDNVSDSVKSAYKAGGAQLQNDVQIVHLIEPNDKREGSLPSRFRFREFYWEAACNQDRVLDKRGYREFPGVTPRWEILANDTYGSSPAMDALGDVIQLQHETKAKAKGLDYMNQPPMLADIQLEHKATALIPGGITYVARLDQSAGARPMYTVNPPINELTMDLRDIQQRIRETFHNPLFNMISQLDTVRSATEIDARREEKLVLLGPVLERFENEALDPAINRIFSIMLRKGMIAPAPEEIAGSALEIQYISILAAAQSAVATVATERFLAFAGNVSAVYPEVRDVPNPIELMIEYGRSLGVPAKGINSQATIAETQRLRAQQQRKEQAMQDASVVAANAKVLSETDVGGGANALQQIMGAVQ